MKHDILSSIFIIIGRFLSWLGSRIFYNFENYIIVERDQSTFPDDRRSIALETLPNVNIRDPSHDKNLPIILYY